jgi:hypothetical protein
LTSKLKYTIGALIILSLIQFAFGAGCSRSGNSTTTPVVLTTAGNQTTPGGLNLTTSSIPIQPTAKQVAASPSPTPAVKPTVPSPGSSSGNTSETALPVFSPTPVPTVPNIDGPPVILIIAPSASSTIAAGDMTVTILVTNFNLVQATGQANKPGEGHIIYYLDGAPLKLPGQPALSLTGKYAKSVIPSYTWHDVKAGYHSLAVQLVNNDDTPLVPAITNTVYVEAR